MPALHCGKLDNRFHFFLFDNHVFFSCPGRILNSLSANSGLLPIFFLHTLQSPCDYRVFKTYVFWRPFVLLLPAINHRSQSLWSITFLPMTRLTDYNFELFVEDHSSQPLVFLFFLSNQSSWWQPFHSVLFFFPRKSEFLMATTLAGWVERVPLFHKPLWLIWFRGEVVPVQCSAIRKDEIHAANRWICKHKVNLIHWRQLPTYP